MVVARLLAVVAFGVALTIAPVLAERPIADLHRLDAYLALFAADSNVPWKATAVRLDTYSSAPVMFSVYAVDPAEVLTAGSNTRPRAIDTRGRRPVLAFTFTPPGGYQFASNDVPIPIGSREGFFVVEARRGGVGEQVWINRTRVGLVAKQTPGELLIYGADLGTGRPLPRMRVQFVVNNAFVTAMTDANGIVRWNRASRPVFALAQWGPSYAFLSLLPQAPLPSTIVGIRTDSAVVHAGDRVQVAGFARTRAGNVLRPSSGVAVVSLRDGAVLVGEQRVSLDGAGAFSAEFALPPNAAAGDYAVLASVNAGVGSATVHVDANAGSLSLRVAAACRDACRAQDDIPLLVHTSQGGATVRVTVVRSPHVYVGYTPADTPWATTTWFDATVRTGDDGNATIEIPHPTDELGSTYGVHVQAGAATADTRVVAPTADAAIRLQLDRTEQALGTAVGFDVYASELDGKPVTGAPVTVTLVHGSSVQQQQLVLDGNGHARGSFASPDLGTSLLFAILDRRGRAVDAAQVQIDPQASTTTIDGGSANVRIDLDRTNYRPGNAIGLSATAADAQGSALMTLESALGVQANVVAVSGGRAATQLRALDAAGELRVGAAFVHDGTIEWNTVPLDVLAAGRPELATVALSNATLAPNQETKIGIGGPPGTYVVRISRETPSGSALFDSAPALLAIGALATQSSAPDSVTWHPWVDSTGDHAQILGFVRRTQPPSQLLLAQADTEAVSWSVVRGPSDAIPVQMPAQGGDYTLSVLDIADDGSVSAGSLPLTVR